MAQVILVTAGRGGVGKSTVTALLGGALARAGKSVLLIEASHRSLDVMFDVADKVLFDLSDILEGRCEVAEAMLQVGATERLQLICAPMEPFDEIPLAVCEELMRALDTHFDFILVEADGHDRELLIVLTAVIDRAIIVATADPVSARDGRSVSDLLAAAGVIDIRLCVNMLPGDFLKRRTIPDLDWLIDQICAQLIAVIPYDKSMAVLHGLSQSINLSNISKMVFDNFAQRILGNYIDLLIQ
ncbi:nucleotide-binding protein [Anaerotruncus rubiinfantis]|uniref:nucleotide-binding protein n=1 Tax=Anaerotruncus rubiinfantis TaxID=1720200 RepID=UPI00082A08F3|nr:P-loop NTPase [Anaerotruncus rubiinfantis]